MLQCRQGSSCTMQPTAVPKSQSHVQVHKLMKKSGIPSYGIRFPCDILFPGNPQRDAMIRWWLGTGLPWIRCKPCWFLVYGRSPAGITRGRKNLRNFRRRDPKIPTTGSTPHSRAVVLRLLETRTLCRQCTESDGQLLETFTYTVAVMLAMQKVDSYLVS